MPPPAFCRQWLAILSAAALLCLPAAWNGVPLLYPDTPTYLRGAETGLQRLLGEGRLDPWIEKALPEANADAAPTRPIVPEAGADAPAVARLNSLDDKVVLAGRSVYYGALLYASHLAGGLGLAVLAQALCAAWLLHLLLVRRWGLGERVFVGIVAVLAAASPLAVFTSLLMPDLFAPLALLAGATLAVYWRRLATGERWVLAGLLLFALCAHASHVAVLGGLLLLALSLRRWRAGWEGLSAPALATVAACLAGALAAEWGFAQVVSRSVGAPPLRLPHLTAHLVDMGPGADFLRRHCPGSGYAACAFARNGPVAWDEFLFSTDPARGAFALADTATKRRLSGEQLRFALDVLRDAPLAVAAGLASDAARQLAMFRVDVWGYGPREVAMFAGRVPASVLAAIKASPCASTHACNEALTLATWAGTLAGLGLVLAWARRGASAPALLPQRFEQFATLALAGLVINAVACAVLAGPLDRFQARAVWLVPLLALSGLAMVRARGRLDAPRRPSTRPPFLQGATT